jgi:tetratricopeptide (TPR) repeat protein
MKTRLKTALLLFLMLVITPHFVFGQMPYHSEDKKAVKNYEEAVRAFNARKDGVAKDLLLMVVNRDPEFFEAWELLSHVQFELGENDEAVVSLYKAVEIDPGFHPENYYYLGVFEQGKGSYTKAKDLFNQYLNSDDKNEVRINISLAAISDCEFAINAMEHPVPFDPINMGPNINTNYPEYLPCLTADDELMIFTRRIKDSRAPEGVQDDLFYTIKNNDNLWLPAKNMGGINSVYNEGAASISADGSTLVFTACELYGNYGPNRGGYGSCDLYIAYRVSTGWSEPMNLGDSINSANWESQPSLSADGRTIYFIRAPRKRRKDNNQDIYVAQKQPNNHWSKAKKLSPVINSPKREETVLIHPDGVTLYFSSNGHPGMGGLDLFMSQKDEAGNWSKPKNLGYPINTLNDENSLMVSANGKLAYFSSNMEGGFGDFDIYAFDLHPSVQPAPVTYVRGVVYDSLTRKPIEAKFELIDL